MKTPGLPPELIAFICFGGSILVTLIVTALVLRRRLAQWKRAFYLTALAFLLAGRIYSDGSRMFTREAWRGLRSPGSALFDASLFVFVGTVICIIPVLALAYYYEKRSKRNEPDAA